MLLRLKGERRDDDILAEDEGDLDLEDRTDRIQPESAFPEEGDADTGADAADEEQEEEGGWPLRGLAIAGATFIPTFLAIVFGLPYLFAPGDTPRAAAVVTPPPMAQRPSDAPVVPPITPSEPVRRSAGLSSEAGTAPSSGDSAKQRDEARAAFDSTLPGSLPALPPIQPQVSDPARPAVAAEPSLPSRPGPKPRAASSEPPAPKTPPSPKESRVATVKESVAVTKETPPVREAVAKDTTGWTPAAAFADRAAAQRLASGIEQQGYPVEIRQDGSSTRPWVVWIGAQPRNGGGQRRR